MSRTPGHGPYVQALVVSGTGAGNIQLFSPSQERVNASMPSAQGFKPATAETRNLACLEGREPVDMPRHAILGVGFPP